MQKQANRQQDISFEIVKHLGVIDTSNTGWSKEVNLVEWNGNPAKLDIREWDPNHEHMSRGITLHKRELMALLKILVKWYGRDLAKEEANSVMPKNEGEPQESSIEETTPLEQTLPNEEAEHITCSEELN